MRASLRSNPAGSRDRSASMATVNYTFVTSRTEFEFKVAHRVDSYRGSGRLPHLDLGRGSPITGQAADDRSGWSRARDGILCVCAVAEAGSAASRPRL
jgi:hypothetical protein